MRRVSLDLRTPQECWSGAWDTALGDSGTIQWAAVLDANLDAGRRTGPRVGRTSTPQRRFDPKRGPSRQAGSEGTGHADGPQLSIRVLISADLSSRGARRSRRRAMTWRRSGLAPRWARNGCQDPPGLGAISSGTWRHRHRLGTKTSLLRQKSPYCAKGVIANAATTDS
jgi:hypothetical protein